MIIKKNKTIMEIKEIKNDGEIILFYDRKNHAL
jgi:hypothetical protein